MAFVEVGDHVRLVASVDARYPTAPILKPGDVGSRNMMEVDLLTLRGRGPLVVV